MEEYQLIWNNVRDVLANKLDPNTFEQTFSEVIKVIKFEGGIIYVLTPSSFVRHRINNLYYKSINEIVKDVTKKDVRFKFVSQDEVNSTPVVEKKIPIRKNDLNPNQTFESFVVGDSNRFATLAALKVAEAPGISFNPLYIFGGVGLGKTHLMQAIGNYISDKNINNKILYVSANEYIDDYLNSIKNNDLKKYDDKYMNLDVLLIDDIQMLTGKNSTQDQFFKLFNYLDNNKKQIVITSDKPATKLNGFMDRLTSRFTKGVSVNIDQPSTEERVQILKRKMSEITNIKIDEEVLLYIAENLTSNVRELEGALNRVILYSELYGGINPNIALAQEALKDIFISTKTEDQKYEDALSVIANMYNITISDILSKTRTNKFVLPRHIAMYVLKTKYDLTYEKIGNILNGKDHTTVMNGCNKIATDIKTNKELAFAIDTIMKKI